MILNLGIIMTNEIIFQSNRGTYHDEGKKKHPIDSLQNTVYKLQI